MDQETNNPQQTPRVMRLNNSYTNEQHKKALRRVAGPKRRYLGLILITVILVLTVPSYGLISSYQSLQNAKKTQVKTKTESSELRYQASSEAQMIKNMQNSFYIQKYARSQYFYSFPGEQIFTTPNSSSADTTTIGK